MTWTVDARLAHALGVCQLTVSHLSLQCATLRLRCAAIGRTTLWKIGPQRRRQVTYTQPQNKVVKYLLTTEENVLRLMFHYFRPSSREQSRSWYHLSVIADLPYT